MEFKGSEECNFKNQFPKTCNLTARDEWVRGKVREGTQKEPAERTEGVTFATHGRDGDTWVTSSIVPDILGH
jgi:hypothetical protein